MKRNTTDRACLRCRERKPLTEEFWEVSWGGRCGHFRTTCLSCRNEMRSGTRIDLCDCHQQAKGHKFGPQNIGELVCNCGRTWEQQQARATECPGAAAQ